MPSAKRRSIACAPPRWRGGSTPTSSRTASPARTAPAPTSELVALTADITPPPDPLVFLRPGSRVNTLSIVSLVAGLLWLGWLGSVAAVVTGHIALHQISRSAGTESGRPAALVGLCFGYCGLAALLFVLLFAF